VGESSVCPGLFPSRDGEMTRSLCGSRGDSPRRPRAALVDCGSADGAQRLVVFLRPHRAVRRRIHRESLAGQLPHIPAAEAALDKPDVDGNIQPEREVTARLSGRAISSCLVLYGRVGCRAATASATISGINTWEQEELLRSLRTRAGNLIDGRGWISPFLLRKIGDCQNLCPRKVERGILEFDLGRVSAHPRELKSAKRAS
jgi:hypothetical protein